MASEWALKQRKIKPHPRTGNQQPRNEWRRVTRQAARRAGVSRRRMLRMINKEKRNRGQA